MVGMDAWQGWARGRSGHEGLVARMDASFFWQSSCPHCLPPAPSILVLPCAALLPCVALLPCATSFFCTFTAPRPLSVPSPYPSVSLGHHMLPLCRLVTLHTPLCRLVTLHTPLCCLVTLHTPLCRLVTLHTPLCRLVTLHTPWACVRTLVHPSSLKPLLATPSPSLIQGVGALCSFAAVCLSVSVSVAP